jgi:hypothetical protein
MKSMPTMNKLLVILPVISPVTTDKCVESLLMENSAAGIEKEDILIVDNSREGFASKYGIRVHRTGHNLGVPRSWNIGAQEVLDKGLDYLVIMSSSMQFGPVLHCTWLSQMQTFWGANVIESDGHSWHLIALHRTLFEKIGLFDTNFHPGYFEQTDWCYRLRMVGLEGGWSRVWVNALSQTVGQHSDMVLATPLLEYYAKKWGGGKGHETFDKPFGDKPLDYFEEVPIPELAKRYKLTEWW